MIVMNILFIAALSLANSINHWKFCFEENHLCIHGKWLIDVNVICNHLSLR